MSRVIAKLTLKAGLHHFPQGVFGSASDLIHAPNGGERDSLLIACSEQGVAPDNVSFARPGRFSILQRLGASLPSKAECDASEGLSCDDIESLFDKHHYRHVIVCGHLDCGIIRNLLQPIIVGHVEIDNFRRRFETGARDLVDNNYSPASISERNALIVCEHVLCQIENLLTHPFVAERVLAQETLLHGWVIDDETARVFGYRPEESAFVRI